MKFVSLWGFHHKWSARMLIFLGYLVLNALALIMGDILYSFDVQVSGLIVYLSAAAYLAAFIVYPASRKRRHYRNYYRFQKGCDAILLVTSFLLLISWASLRHNANSPFHFPAAQAVVPVNVQPSIAQAPATKDKV